MESVRSAPVLQKVQNIIAKADQKAGSWDDEFDLYDNDGNFSTREYDRLTEICKRKLPIASNAFIELGDVLNDLHCGGKTYISYKRELSTTFLEMKEQFMTNVRTLCLAANEVDKENISNRSEDLEKTSDAILDFMRKTINLLDYLEDAETTDKKFRAHPPKISETTHKTNSSYCKTFTKIAVAVAIVSFVAFQVL